ncbi:putative reverse transcriptase domain-containing protein [Tanacetum coccineum]
MFQSTQSTTTHQRWTCHADSRGFLADSDSMEDDTDANSIDYPDKPEDGEDDDEDPEEDPSEEHESEDDEAKEDEPFEDSDETEPFEEDETAATPPSPGRRGARITVRPQPPMAASTQTLVDAGSPLFPSLPPTNPTYNQAPLGHRAAMIRMRDDIPLEDMPPRRRFVLTASLPGCDIAESSAAAARASRGQAANRAEDVGYARALQASEHRMMTSIEEVNLRVSYQVQARKRESEDFYTQLLDARTDRRDIRLEVDVVRGHRTAYETELQEVRQAYLRSEVQNRALLARLETLETHMTRMEWQRQRDEDNAVRQIIIMPITRQGTNDAMTPESIQAMIDRAIQRNSTQDDDSQNSGGGIRRPVQLARVCTYPDFMKCQPLNFKGTEGVVGLNQWLEKMESVFHISGCAVENQVKFATCTLLGAALTWWNGHVRTLGHDAAYAMTWGTFKKKLSDKYCPNGEIKKLEIELWNLKVKGNDVAAYTQRFQELALMCTKFLADETAKIDKYIGGLPDNIHGNVMSARPKTLDFAIELANDLMDQKLRTYAERQNENKRKADDSIVCYWGTYLCAPSAITTILGNVHPSVENAREKLPKTEEPWEQQRNGPAQGRAYALGGRDASPDSNVITGTFLLNNRYATVLFDTGADRSFLSNTFSTMIDITPLH